MGTVTLPSVDLTENVTVSPASNRKAPEASVVPDKPEGEAL
jgi:hypothetical protein